MGFPCINRTFHFSILQLDTYREESCIFFVRNLVSATLFGKAFSGSDKHQPGSIGQVSEVKQEVEGSEHRHSDQFWHIVASVLVLFVKLEHGPNDGSGQVHDNRQEPVSWQELGEGDGEAAGALAHTQHHHSHGEDEADAVDGHAPLERCMGIIGHRVADQDEDNTGHKGLAHLQQAWSCSHVTCHLSWPRFAQAHLPHVGYRCQAGEDCGGDAMAVDIAIKLLVLEEKKWEDDGGR